MKKGDFTTLISAKLKVYYNFVVVGISLVFVFSLMGNFVKIRNIDKRVEKAKERVEKLKQENSDLTVQVEDVQADAYVEKKLRDSLGLAKEGEIVLVMPDESVLRRLAPKDELEVEELPDANWKKWMKLFL